MKNFVAGTFVRTMTGYRAFLPENINRNFTIDDPEILLLQEQAAVRLGELNAFLELVPDIAHFIRLHVVKEATLSSRIEGTQTRLEEVLLEEEDVSPERRDDWREVNNYIRALHQGIGLLEELPLSTRLIKKIHATLLDGVRGEFKMPGEFRRSQNWIGGASLLDASFIPPEWQEVDRLMSDLENFLHNPDLKMPMLLKIALMHYQFETIHPFLDGNGRVGRLMIPIYLHAVGLLRQPALYMSEFFEQNRGAYYDNLMRVRTHHEINTWFKFFLVGVEKTCAKGCAGLRSILALKLHCEKELIPQLGRKMPQANILLQHLFAVPVIKPAQVIHITGLSTVACYRLIEDFERLGILREISGRSRNRIFTFQDYFTVFKP